MKSRNASAMSARPISPDDFPIIERLFGPKGACGGCWCMYWRVPSTGADWEAMKGEKARRSFRRLVESGAALGCLAFAGAEPVGWCSVGAREEFPYLQRARTIPRSAPDATWSITCFYILKEFRREGLSGLLIDAACKFAKSKGARFVEAYPNAPQAALAPAFAHTGLVAPFVRRGFEIISDAGARRVVRKPL